MCGEDAGTLDSLWRSVVARRLYRIRCPDGSEALFLRRLHHAAHLRGANASIDHGIPSDEFPFSESSGRRTSPLRFDR